MIIIYGIRVIVIIDAAMSNKTDQSYIYITMIDFQGMNYNWGKEM